MSERLQSLYLPPYTSIEFDTQSVRERSRRQRDIQTIHDPSRSRAYRMLQRYTGSFTLRAKPSGDSRALFAASVSADLEGGFDVKMGSFHSWPRQAAGWAALQLYRERSGDPPLDHLIVVDPLASTAERFQARFIHEAVGLVDGLDKPPNHDLARTGVLVAPMLPPGVTEGSAVRIKNDDQQSLPQVLQAAQQAYDILWPGEDTSATVAGIVSAVSLEEFSSAWGAASQHASPVLAARALLQSDVFYTS